MGKVRNQTGRLIKRLSLEILCRDLAVSSQKRKSGGGDGEESESLGGEGILIESGR